MKLINHFVINYRCVLHLSAAKDSDEGPNGRREKAIESAQSSRRIGWYVFVIILFVSY